jgi:hypothetical protein
MTTDDREWLDALLAKPALARRPQLTADDTLAALRRSLPELELLGALVAEAHRDAARLRRLLDDPDLAAYLMDREDRAIFGESVAEMERRDRLEGN